MKIFIANCVECPLNYQDAYIMSELKSNFEITEEVKEADILIFPNSCAASFAYIIESLDYINKILKKKKPGAITFLTGCLARKIINHKLDPLGENLNKMFDFVIPQDEPDLLLKILSPEKFGNKIDGISGRFWVGTDKQGDNKQGTIYLSSGCLNTCSFCKRSFHALPLKSLDFDLVKQVIDDLDEKGFPELVIRGTNVSQYGIDTCGKYLLPELIEHIEKKENIKRLKLIGFAFKDAIKGNFAGTLADSQKLTLLSGGLESGSDRILERMRKGFTSEEFVRFVETVNKKEILHLNLIAGFPSETMDDVKATLEVLRRIREYLKLVAITRYMDSPFVDSHKYAQLDNSEIKDHARIYQKVLSRYGKCDELGGTLLEKH